MNVDVIETDWQSQNFRIINTEDSTEKGVCYEETKQTWVSLIRHISIEDIISTSIEESIHQSIRSDTDESINCNIEQEEWIVERILWVLEGWML